MRHRFHALCPYFAMFPEDFAASWIERLSEPGDLVADPFCGRGTTPFQALLMGREAVGNDINPVAYCVSRAKTNAPAKVSVKRRITGLENKYREGEWRNVAEAQPPFFQHAYSTGTLAQIVFLRDRLDWRGSEVDCMLAALMLGILHGETQKSPSYLSNQMPRTISTKPEYSIRFWQKHGYQAPKRDTFQLLRTQLAYRYQSDPPEGRATVLEGDFRDLAGRLGQERHKVRLVVTSPPYLDVTNFEEDQWLRLWFLGGPPHPTYRRVSRDDRHENPSRYWELIGDMWRVLGALVAPGGHVVVRIGGRSLKPEQISRGLEATSLFARRSVELVSTETSPIRGRQTDSFRPGSKGCGQEVDCCFRLN